METIPRSQNHLAELLGISNGAASKQASRGMPTHSLEAAQAWRKAHLDPARVKGTRFDQYRKPVQPLPAQEPAAPELPNYAFNRNREKAAEAEMAEIRLAEEKGELIRVEAVKSSLGILFASTRDALLQIPARMAPLLAAESTPAAVQNLLHAEIHQALVQLAGARIGRAE